MTEGRITNAMEIRAFVLAGKARFTIRSVRTGVRFTYRVNESDQKGLYFVQLMTGSDNERSYTYLGTIRNGVFRHGHKSRIGIESSSVIAFAYLWDSVHKGRISTQLEFWHEGRCARCARPLTDPVSIEHGFGPECLGKAAREIEMVGAA